MEPNLPGFGKDKLKSFYRQAFAEADILISEGFLNVRPHLPIAVKKSFSSKSLSPLGHKILCTPLSLAIITSLVS